MLFVLRTASERMPCCPCRCVLAYMSPCARRRAPPNSSATGGNECDDHLQWAHCDPLRILSVQWLVNLGCRTPGPPEGHSGPTAGRGGGHPQMRSSAPECIVGTFRHSGAPPNSHPQMRSSGAFDTPGRPRMHRRALSTLRGAPEFRHHRLWKANLKLPNRLQNCHQKPARFGG
eukprot:1945864-Alexandrium_andersonii.AAC.1